MKLVLRFFAWNWDHCLALAFTAVLCFVYFYYGNKFGMNPASLMFDMNTQGKFVFGLMGWCVLLLPFLFAVELIMTVRENHKYWWR